jgi:hypothetical protein
VFTLKMENAVSSEIFVNIYLTAEHNNLVECNLQQINLYIHCKLSQATHLTKCKMFWKFKYKI